MSQEKYKLMLDLETADTADTSIIFQIGGCLFTDTKIINSFSLYIKWADDEQKRTMSPRTIAWWDKQDPEVKQEVWYGHSEGRMYLEDALMKMTSTFTFEKTPISEVWSKGAFDFNILTNAYNQFIKPPFWRYSMVRDYRTFLSEAYKQYGYKETKCNNHNAESDAINQAQNMINIYKLMSKKPMNLKLV